MSFDTKICSTAVFGVEICMNTDTSVILYVSAWVGISAMLDFKTGPMAAIGFFMNFLDVDDKRRVLGKLNIQE